MKKFIYALKIHTKKNQFLIKKPDSVNSKYCNDPKSCIENSDNIDDIYDNINDYNPNKKRKMLILLDDMIGDMLSNKNVIPQ